jgi:DNA polymerase-1
LAVDTETWDPDLEDFGPGWGRRRGHIVGVSIAADNDGRWYFPMRHETEPSTNMNPDHVLAWLKHSLADPKQPKVGANLTYDYGWLCSEGVTMAGELIDVQFAEALLDERAHVSLDILGQKYLGNGKETADLYQWLSDWFGGAVGGGQRKHIYRAPPRLVGPYAEGDVDLPMRLAPILYQHLHNEGLTELFSMECRLIRLMVEMRLAGVTVDIPKAQILADDLLAREKALQEKLDYFAGQRVDINSSASLASAFDRFGIPYGKTPKGAPSFTKDFLGLVNHPIGEIIREIRKLAKLRGTFIQSYLLDSHIDGKVYGQFHQLRGDDGGTRSGRLSSSTPNLQNIPSRDDELAPLIRGMFIPDYGHQQWRKYDYSQIEYRFLIHYAVGPGAEEARRLFNEHPDTDYHEMALDLVGPEAGWDVSTPELRKKHRRPIKNINFGLIFGMGVPKLTASLGLSQTEGKDLFAAYHKGVPFAKPTMDACSAEALAVGNITTILGRKSRFDLWEPSKWQNGADGHLGLNYQQAILKFGGDIRRAFTHKALNRRLQGSAADLMKKAMLVCYESGIFEATGVPRLTVHDELDFSDPGGRDEAFEAMKHVMETAIPLKIPVRADGECGPDWGHVK